MFLPVWIYSFLLLFFVPRIPLDLCLLGIVLGRGRWKDPELAEQPGDPVGGLGTDAQPILEAILLEADLLHPIPVGDRVVGSQYLQVLAVPGRTGVGGDHPVKRGMGPAEALQSEADNHLSFVVGGLFISLFALCGKDYSNCRRICCQYFNIVLVVYSTVLTLYLLASKLSGFVDGLMGTSVRLRKTNTELSMVFCRLPFPSSYYFFVNRKVLVRAMRFLPLKVLTNDSDYSNKTLIMKWKKKSIFVSPQQCLLKVRAQLLP